MVPILHKTFFEILNLAKVYLGDFQYHHTRECLMNYCLNFIAATMIKCEG